MPDPFFIVGVHRSGTTLLRYMFNSSPNIYIPEECNFIPEFFGKNPREQLGQKRVEFLLQRVFTQHRQQFSREWQGDPPDSAEFFKLMTAPTPAGFLDALYTLYARQHGAGRWGDKTPFHTSYIELLHQIFPTAKFIHIIRDGRDVGLSMLERFGPNEFHVDRFFVARNWVRRIRHAQAAGRRLGPAFYTEVRYAALVENPEAELKRLCDFVGEPFVPVMAQPQKLGRQQIPDGEPWHGRIREAPSNKRVGKWQTQMSQADLWMFQRIAGGLLAELGFPVVEVEPPSPAVRAQFWALAAKYGVLQAGRRVAQAIGLKPPN
jgi:hypothetical protein